MRQFFASVLEVVEITIVAVGAVFLIRTFLIQPFLVSGSSMVPNFSDGDYLLVDQITYRFRAPERGEVVVFRSPGDSSIYFIKRIIGLPGEKVAIKNGEIKVFNQSGEIDVKEGYIPSGVSTGGNSEWTLNSDQYFLLGDNRPSSFDSRSWGPLPAENIIGLARLRLWPIPDFKAFAAPQY